MIEEMERQIREQSMSYMTELSNNMRQFNTEWEQRLDEATRWTDERASIIVVVEETRVELESRIESV